MTNDRVNEIIKIVKNTGDITDQREGLDRTSELPKFIWWAGLNFVWWTQLL